MTWEIMRTPKYERGYSKLSSDAKSRCDSVVEELACSERPELLGERLSGGGYKYRFGKYRLSYDVSYQLVLLALNNVDKRSRSYAVYENVINIRS